MRSCRRQADTVAEPSSLYYPRARALRRERLVARSSARLVLRRRTVKTWRTCARGCRNPADSFHTPQNRYIGRPALAWLRLVARSVCADVGLRGRVVWAWRRLSVYLGGWMWFRNSLGCLPCLPKLIWLCLLLRIAAARAMLGPMRLGRQLGRRGAQLWGGMSCVVVRGRTSAELAFSG